MAEKKGIMSKIGVWAYIIGIILAIVVGFLASAGLTSMWVAILAVLGVIVSLLNISDEEVQTFLLGSVAFVVAAGAMGVVFASLAATGVPGMMGLFTVTQAVVVFTAPGTLIVAFKALYNVAKDD